MGTNGQRQSEAPTARAPPPARLPRDRQSSCALRGPGPAPPGAAHSRLTARSPRRPAGQGQCEPRRARARSRCDSCRRAVTRARR